MFSYGCDEILGQKQFRRKGIDLAQCTTQPITAEKSRQQESVAVGHITSEIERAINLNLLLGSLSTWTWSRFPVTEWCHSQWTGFSPQHRHQDNSPQACLETHLQVILDSVSLTVGTNLERRALSLWLAKGQTKMLPVS